MNTIKTLIRYALYTLLYLCCFAFVHFMIWWISQDYLWYKEMLETDYGRAALVMMFLGTIGLSSIACSYVE